MAGTDVSLGCACGAVKGVARGLSPSAGNRVVCYCGDCQSFAHFLDRADDVLDAHGGTDIYQTVASRIEITEGRDRLACVRLTGRGPLRWYTSCCRTPIGNTMPSAKMAFVGSLMMLRMLRILLLARLTRGASPFFDRATGEPLAMPHRLSDAERAQVEAARDSGRAV